MGVVVEGAPADSTGVLRARSKLVVDAGMANGVLSEALDLVNCFRRIGVTAEFGVQITWMIRGLERETEVVHGEDVFEEFRFLEVADSARLAGGIELMRECVGAGVEIVIVARLVDANSPQNNGGAIPVAANHSPDIIDRDVLPVFVANVLPTGDLFQHKQADLVTGIQEVA